MTAPSVEPPPSVKQSASAVPPESQAPDDSWGWTRTQRIGLALLSTILLIFLAIQYCRRPFRMNDGPVIIDGVPIALPERVDPNLASKEELSRIPHIGEAMAGKIIAWRDARLATAPDGVVFHSVDDLDHVPGIGKALLEIISPYLKFPPADPGELPATLP